MATDTASGFAQTLIGGRYAVDMSRPLGSAGGGLAAFGAADRQGAADLMGVLVRPWHPPRAAAMAALVDAAADGVLMPLAHGPGPSDNRQPGYFVICPAPPGPPVAEGLRPWSEAELLNLLLRPAVSALQVLHAHHVTHRAIRPDNVFRAGPGHPVVLGSAWAAPPASLQPALFEPPYAAMCLPAGRGDGTIADDIYALGVVMLVLALGRTPLAGLDEAGVVRAKLDRGSFAALAGNARLPGMVADLARGMLAEDPEHRPTIGLMADLATARSRRVAARPIARAQQPLEVAGETVWNARGLAYALATRPDEGLQLLRTGGAVQWLRRSVADPGLAMRVEEQVRGTNLEGGAAGAESSAVLLMQSVALLDPLAPLCWLGACLWPDGIGPALAAAQDGAQILAERLEEIIRLEVTRFWGASRSDRFGGAALRVSSAKQRAILRVGGPGHGRVRLLYAINPLLACASPILAKSCVARMQDLLPALEASDDRGSRGSSLPADAHLTAFVEASLDQPPERDMAAAGPKAAVAQLRFFARLQARFHPRPLPALAGWLADHADALVAGWQNRDSRERLKGELQTQAQAGQLGAMLALVEDAPALEHDARSAENATRMLASADLELRSIETGGEQRSELARRLGQEAAAGLGLAALVTALGFAAFG